VNLATHLQLVIYFINAGAIASVPRVYIAWCFDFTIICILEMQGLKGG
jgi:hypothetical protein